MNGEPNKEGISFAESAGKLKTFWHIISSPIIIHGAGESLRLVVSQCAGDNLCSNMLSDNNSFGSFMAVRSTSFCLAQAG